MHYKENCEEFHQLNQLEVGSMLGYQLEQYCQNSKLALVGSQINCHRIGKKIKNNDANSVSIMIQPKKYVEENLV